MLTREPHNPLHQTKLFHHPKITTRATPYLSLYIINSRCPFCRTEYCWVSHFLVINTNTNYTSFLYNTTTPMLIHFESKENWIEHKPHESNREYAHNTHIHTLFEHVLPPIFMRRWPGTGSDRLQQCNPLDLRSRPRGHFLPLVLFPLRNSCTLLNQSIAQHTMLQTHYKRQIPARRTRWGHNQRNIYLSIHFSLSRILYNTPHTIANKINKNNG